MKFRNGVTLNTEEGVYICTVFTDLKISKSTFRVDPHPEWSRDYKKVCFNGAPDEKRKVFIADINEQI